MVCIKALVCTVIFDMMKSKLELTIMEDMDGDMETSSPGKDG